MEPDQLTVGQLIDKLQAFNPELPVCVQQQGSDYDYSPALGVAQEEVFTEDYDDNGDVIEGVDGEPKTTGHQTVCIGVE